MFFPLHKQGQTKQTDMSHHLTSKTAKCLYIVFGLTDEVKTFDKHHTLFKDFRYTTSANICAKIKSSFRQRIIETTAELESKINNWEREFFTQNEREPLGTDISGEVKEMYRRFSNAKKLMRTWMNEKH